MTSGELHATPLRARRRWLRTPGQQLLLLFLGSVLVIGIVMLLLAWASGGTGAATGVDAETGTITMVLDTEPPQLNSSLSADQISSRVLGHIMEGLTRQDAAGDLAPGVAERWEITATGATFWLRPDAKWSDGKPVTAHDFVFAWRNTVDPESASEYAQIMFGIRNAEAISAGKLPITALGATAISDRELRVEFAQPVPYFDRLTAFTVFYPIREDFYRSTGGRYASSADTLLYNGAFRMDLWTHGAHIRLLKNENYWNRDTIKLNVIDFPYFTTDGNTIINLFRDGKIALAPIAQENIQQAKLQGWDINSFASGSVFYIEFNHRPDHVTRNLNFRKAIQYTMDSSEQVNQVIRVPGFLPGKSLFPVWLDGVNDKFRTEYPVREVPRDLEKARYHLELARKELGLESFPPIMLLTGDSPLANRAAEYHQQTLKQALGLDIRIDMQIFKQRLAKMLVGEFDMVMAGWGADYADPLTYGDLFHSSNGNNRGRFNSPELDRQVDIARASMDPKTRMDAFGRIQEILVDQVAIVPEYERASLYVLDPRLAGVKRRVVGFDPDFTYARIVEK